MLAGKMKNEKKIGMKMAIITSFGDRNGSGTFFIIVWDEDQITS